MSREDDMVWSSKGNYGAFDPSNRDTRLAEFDAACRRMRDTRARRDLIFEGIMIAMEEMNKGDDNPGPRIMERLDRAAEKVRDA